jgi:diadenosine tetraphosphatase ApaH/serine/threonine PP2A family protein phosphatase
MDDMKVRIGAVGHSHVALWFRRDSDPGSIDGDTAPDGTELDLSEGDWIVNPGSVGQPRDGDPRAAWMLLDLAGWQATWRRVEYPVEQAAHSIEAAGLPVMLAERLYVGQ